MEKIQFTLISHNIFVSFNKNYIMNEIWREIKNFEGLYQVSNYGRVKSLARTVKGLFDSVIYKEEQLLKLQKYPNGYNYVGLCKNGVVKNYLVHRLVAEAFIENSNNLPQVNHINECITDNRAENLEWVSAKTNANWGTRNNRVAEKHSISILQLSVNGDIMKEWDSGAEVEKVLGYKRTNICACCKGKAKTAYGFKWCYK